MNLKKEYEKVNTPEELLIFMDNIKYGIHGKDNINYKPGDTKEENIIFQNACQNVYGLASPEYILKFGIGHCWDQVELERDWFTKHNYEFKTIFIWFEFDYENNYSTHTYLIYKDNNDYCYFEHADYNNKGIHRFKSYEDAIKYQYNKHIDYNKSIGNIVTNKEIKHIHIYEYNNPKYSSNMSEFIDYILNSKEITKILNNNN